MEEPTRQMYKEKLQRQCQEWIGEQCRGKMEETKGFYEIVKNLKKKG